MRRKLCFLLLSTLLARAQSIDTIRRAVTNAKAQGRTSVTLAPMLVETIPFTAVSQALASYPAMAGTLKDKQTVVDGVKGGERLQTYLRFEIDKRLSGPPPSFDHEIPIHVPGRLRSLSEQEVVIVAVGAGQFTTDGITVSSPANDLSDLVPGEHYVMLTSFPSASRMGALPYGLAGVWKINDGMLIPLRPNSRVAEAFKKAGLTAPEKVTAYFRSFR